MDEIPFSEQAPVAGIGQWTGTLLHERRGRVRRDARDVDAPRGQFHDHEHVVGHQAVPCRDEAMASDEAW